MKSLKGVKGLIFIATLGFLALVFPTSVFASVGPDIKNFTSSTLGIITAIATASAVFFLIKGGYQYITSTGNPENLSEAKKTIRNALIGLCLVIAAGFIISLFSNALISSSQPSDTSTLNLTPVNSATPNSGLTQLLIDAVGGFIRNIVESATKPVVDGIIGYLTTTPGLLGNSVIFKFWLVTLGITNCLFVLIVALLGLHFMSASTFGFEEMELRQLLPRIGLAFLGANVSLFLADYVVTASNALVKEVLNSTGGLNHAWISDALNLPALATGATPLITLIFLVLFLIIAIVLLLMYITRLIMISLGAVLSPFIFLLWTIPKLADTAEIAVKTYLVTVFMTFVHIVVIQLASSFLTLPEHSENSLISIVVAIGLFLTLLKTPSIMMQLVFYNSGRGIVKKVGGQIINVITAAKDAPVTPSASGTAAKVPRKVVSA